MNFFTSFLIINIHAKLSLTIVNHTHSYSGFSGTKKPGLDSLPVQASEEHSIYGLL